MVQRFNECFVVQLFYGLNSGEVFEGQLDVRRQIRRLFVHYDNTYYSLSISQRINQFSLNYHSIVSLYHLGQITQKNIPKPPFPIPNLPPTLPIHIPSLKTLLPFFFIFALFHLLSILLFFHIQRMFRAIPVSNKLCFDKQIKRSWKIHESKLNCLKGSVGKERPERFEFLDQRPKKIALQEVRNIEVDRQNQALLKKIKTIESKGCKTSYARLYEDLSENKKKTLNEPYRKRELVKIIEENQDILKRLQHKRSEYSIKKMEKERKVIEKNISLISEFPYKHFPKSHTSCNLWATTEQFYSSASQPSELNFTFKGEREIEGYHYNIVSYLTKGNFYLEMEGIQDRKEKYRIELPEQKARDLLKVSYNGRIESMVANLSIDRQKQLCFLRYSPQ